MNTTSACGELLPGEITREELLYCAAFDDEMFTGIITGAQLFLTLIANVILFSSWFQRYRVYPRGKELAAVVVLMYAVADLFMPSGIKYGVLVVGILVGCLLPDSWKVDD